MSEASEPIPTAAATRPVSPERQGPFGPIAPGSRVTYVWATPLAQIGMYLISVVPALIVTAAVVVPLMLASETPVTADGTLPPQIELWVLLTALIIQFPAWAIFIAFWVKGFERRSLASAGLRGPFALKQYGIGLLAGIGVAVVLALLSPFVDSEAAIQAEEGFEAARLLEPQWLLMMSGVVALFLVQGACEEIAFRGWMMSAVAARRGMVMGVIVNIAVFGALHAHVFASGLVAGTAAIIALTCVGLFLSLWAIAERSIAGVCGLHGAFNATIVIFGIIGMAASSPDATPGQVLLDTIREATALEGDASSAGALLQFAVFAAFSALIWRWLRTRRPDFR
jgi:membrane protease YdiL (CAAX protease family)